MKPRRPFSILRAGFFLLTFIVAVQMLLILATGVTCAYMVVFRDTPIGSCLAAGIWSQARETWELALTTVLALLMANRRRDDDEPPPE
jgi:hypothetical protein